MNDTLPERFAARMGQLLGPDFPTDIALAVSGGGDSMAMLALAHDWARVFGVTLWVVTVDHGLRAESADEAAMVARECANLGHPHATLRWTWDGQGNLQDAARRARLELIDRWRGGIEHVLMAHTQDDVAETFLMRLARGSGVEGLSAMADKREVRPHVGSKRPLDPDEVKHTDTPPIPTRRVAGVPAYSAGFTLLRPLLRESRSDLRHHIRTLKVPFVDDPTNEDPTFDRARFRAALSDLGIDAGVLANTAHRLARARDALSARAADAVRDILRPAPFMSGAVCFDRDAFATIERDTQLRVLAGALCWTSSSHYRPRSAALEALLDRVLAGGGGTLHGAQIDVGRERIEVFRELAAITDLRDATGSSTLWDNRWLIYGAEIKEREVRALGDDGWRQLPKRPPVAPTSGSEHAPQPPRHAIARTLPAVFDGDRLVAFLPHHFGPPYVSEFRPPSGQFITFLLSR